MKYWSGKVIEALEPNQVFVFDSNPEGHHSMGTAKAAMKFGAVYGKGRGLQGQTYALVTKNLKAGFTEPNGITYPTAGKHSVSLARIVTSIIELYTLADKMPDKDFLVAYQNNSNSLNGYTPQEMFRCFKDNIPMPSNIVMHESFKPKPDFKVLVTGGRDFTDFNYLTRMLDSVLREKCKSHSIVIVSGKAQGADNLGEEYAKLRGYKINAHPADWKDITCEGAVIRSNNCGEYNAIAGHMRNEDMAIECNVGVVFWDGYSTGTEDMIKRLNKHKKSMRTFNY